LEHLRPWDIARVQEALALRRSIIAGGAANPEDLLVASELAAWLTQRSPEKADREALSRIAVEFAAGALAREVSGRAHYLRAVALGLFAREHPLSSTGLPGEILQHGRQAERLEPDQDGAGPSRLLCLLLAQAPAWPAGPGDLDEAIAAGERAVARADQHPGNHLALAAALLADERDEQAAPHIARAHELIAQHAADRWQLDRWREEQGSLQQQLGR
jgi:hypothetical protein